MVLEFQSVSLVLLLVCCLNRPQLSYAQCDMWQPPLAVPFQGTTTTFSMIVSPFGTYFNDQACHWKLQCPTGWHMYLSMSIATAETADNFTLYSDETKSNRIAVLYGTQTYTSFLVNQNEIYLTFISNGKLAAAGLVGPPSFTCYVVPCHRNSTTRTITSSGKQIILTTILPNEECFWEVRCPAGDWMFFSGRPIIDGLNITDTDGNLLNITNFRSFVPLPFVSFYADYRAPSSSARLLFSVECSEPDACPAHQHIVDPQQSVVVPRLAGDGQSYLNNVNCSWTIECPNNLWLSLHGRYALWPGPSENINISYQNRTGHNIAVLYKGSTHYCKQCDPKYTAAVHGFNTLMFTHKVDISFQSGYYDFRDDARSYVQLSYNCWVGDCISSNDTKPTEIISNYTVESFSSDFPKEECEWNISCTNSSAEIVFYDFSGDVNDIVLINASGIQEPFVQRVPLPRSQFLIRYRQRRARLFCKFLCMQPIGDICKEMYNYSGSVAGSLDFPRTIFGEYYNNIRCRYNISCPFSDGGIQIKVGVYTFDMSDNFTIYERNSINGELELLKVIGGHAKGKKGATLPIPINQMFRMKQIFIHFTSDFALSFPGFVGKFEYLCYETPCHTNNTETIGAQYEGVAPPEADALKIPVFLSSVIPGEACNYVIRCQQPHLEMYWLQVDIQGGEDTVKMSYLSNGTTAPFPRGDWLDIVDGYILNFTGQYSGPGSFSFAFECIDRQTTVFCQGQEMNVTVVQQTATFSMPVHRLKYFHDMDCRWRIRCPNGMNIGLIGGIQSHYSDEFRIYAADGSTLLKTFKGASGQMPGVMGTSGQLTYDPVNHLFKHSELLATFITDSKDKHAGFYMSRMTAQCYVGTCSSNLTNARVLTHAIGAPAITVTTEMFREDCDYILQCANPIGWISWEGEREMDKKYLSMVVNLQPPVPVPLPLSSSMQPATPLKLEYKSHGDEFWFKFLWACFYSDKFERSACGFRALQRLSEPKGGDVSMPINPFGKYYNQLLCNWIIQCPSSMNVAFYGTLYTPSEDDYLQVMDANETELFVHHGSSSVLAGQVSFTPATFAYLLRTTTIRLRFQSDSAHTMNGFSPVKYMCITGNCTSNLTTPRQFVYSPGDAAITMGNTFDYEDCEWILLCNVTQDWMVFGFFTGVTTQTVTIFDVDGDSMPTPDVADMIPMSYIKVRYQHPPGQKHRFEINYQCFSPFVGSPCAPGAVRLFIGSRGVMSLPLLPNRKYGTNLICTWEIRCPYDTGSVELRGALSTHSPEDNFTVYDGAFHSNTTSAIRSHFTETAQMPPQKFRYLIRKTVISLRFMSNASGGAFGLVETFWYFCHPKYCSSPASYQPIVYYSGQPVINTSTNADGEECEWQLQCDKETECLFIEDISSNLTGVKIVTLNKAEILFDRIIPVVIPVSALVIQYTSPAPGHHFYFAFKCVPQPQPKFCLPMNNYNIRRLWNSFTWVPTKSATLEETVTATASSSTTRTLTEDAVITSSETLSSVSLSKSLTRPPTRTRSSTVTYDESITETVPLTSSSTRTDTSSLPITQSATLTTTESSTFSDSFMMNVQFSIHPSILNSRAIRGELPPEENNRQFTIRPIGATFNMLTRVDRLKKLIYERTKFDVHSTRKDHSLEANGFQYRRQVMWQLEGLQVDAYELNVTFSKDVKFYLQSDEVVVIKFPASVFVGGELGAVLQHPNITLHDDIPTRQLTSFETVSGVSAGAASVVSVNPAMATQAGKVLMIARLASCTFPVDEPLSPISNPLGVAVTDSPYRFYIGAMIFNPVLLIGILVLQLLFGFIVSKLRRISLTEGLTVVYCPSYLLPFLMFFVGESMFALGTVLLHENALLYKCIALCMFVIFPWGTFFVWISYFLLHHPKLFLSWYEKAPKRKFFSRFLWGDGDWEDAPLSPDRSRGFTRMYGKIFDAYREKRRWFVLAEILVSVLTGLAQCVQPPAGNCAILSWVIFGPILALYAVAVLLLSPFAALWEQIFNSVLAVAEAMAVFFIAYATTKFEPGPDRNNWLEKSEVTMIGVEWGLLSKLVIDVLLLISEIIGNAIIEKDISDGEDEVNKAPRKKASAIAKGQHDRQTTLLNVPLLQQEPPRDHHGSTKRIRNDENHRNPIHLLSQTREEESEYNHRQETSEKNIPVAPKMYKNEVCSTNSDIPMYPPAGSEDVRNKGLHRSNSPEVQEKGAFSFLNNLPLFSTHYDDRDPTRKESARNWSADEMQALVDRNMGSTALKEDHGGRRNGLITELQQIVNKISPPSLNRKNDVPVDEYELL